MPMFLVTVLLVSLNTALLRAEGARNFMSVIRAMAHLLFSDCDVFIVTDSSKSYYRGGALIDLHSLPWDITSRDCARRKTCQS